jgi:ArsR family transcriptional regulator
LSTSRRASRLRLSRSENRLNLILQVISNRTRRNILLLLSKEPMYFNELAGKLNVGQQAILRHMKLLERSGLVEAYPGKSTLGAPARKYYNVKSTFNLNVSLSRDSFTLVNREIKNLENTDMIKSYDTFKSKIVKHDKSDSLYYHREILIEIEQQITDLEVRANDLKIVRQHALSNLRDVYQHVGLDSTERSIIRAIIQEAPRNLNELIELMNMSRTDLDEALRTLSLKLDPTDSQGLLEKYIKSKTVLKM